MNLVVFSIFLTLFSISNGRSALDKRYRFDYIEEVDDPEIEFINETLRNFNKIRRRYAIDEQVPNVWKLTWSESLVQKIKKLPKDCNALVPKDGYRFFFLHSENTDRKRQKWENDHMGALFRHNYSNFSDLYVDASKKSVLWAELIQRNQKEIGCGKYKCRGWKVLQISWRNHGETNNFDEICLIGPQTEFIWPHKHVNGTPGSNLWIWKIILHQFRFPKSRLNTHLLLLDCMNFGLLFY
ncbi:unnamed protein product [Caenorhabditis nigoni]